MTRKYLTLTAGYALLLQILLIALPVPLILYFLSTGLASERFENWPAHETLVGLSIVEGALVALVTWLCYRESREPVLRWLTLAFLAFTAIYTPHGLMTPHAATDPWMFLLFGPASRLAMTGFMVIGLLSWGLPAEPKEGAFGRWMPSAAVILALTGATCMLAATPYAPTARLVGENGTIILCLIAVIIIVVRQIFSQMMKVYIGTLALFAESCWAFIQCKPWTHLWWAAHFVFLSGFLLLSYGVARAYLSTRSFTKVYSQREMMARLSAATSDAETAQANAEQMRRLFAAKPLGVIVLSPTGEVIFTNHRLAVMAARVTPPERLLEVLSAAIARTAEGHEVELQLAGIEPLFFNATWLPLRFQGQDATVAWLFDVSDLKAAVAAAQRANTAKSRFLAAASHDIRQPLVPIKLFAELLESEVTEPTSVDLVRKMRSSLQSLDDLLTRLLDFSRLEAGAVQPHRERVALGPLLTRLRHEFEPVARAQGLTFRVVDSSAAVVTDHVLLDQILRNLVENALRYTPGGKVLVGCRRRGSRISLQVADTGIGIPEDQQKAVFGEFFQIGNQNRNRKDGLGLGLATVDRLCHLLGHAISLSSTEGKGSVFSVDMARDLSPAARREVPTDHRSTEWEPLRVLLIEDDDGAREAVTLAFAKWGWQVTPAATCAEAVAVVALCGRPDVIVSDLRLEAELSGLDAIRMVGEACAAEIPAVIITGDDSHPDLAAASHRPFLVVLKPFSAQQLRTTVATAMRNAG